MSAITWAQTTVARSTHDYSRDRSRSHHDEDRYDEECHGGDRDGRRTPRSHRDRQLRTREDSRERQRGHRSHREEPPSYSRREDDGRDYGDRDRGRQGYPHDTHMERDLRSQPPLTEASGSGYRRHLYGHE